MTTQTIIIMNNKLYKRILLGCIALMSVFTTSAQEVCDENCIAGDDTLTYKVVAPVGHQTVEMITMAPRLTTLEGKTIALVGGSFMASVTHVELRKIILENYPTAKIYLLSEIGSAGLYPAPGVKRQQVEEFKRKLQEYGVEAVVSGNGGCGICTPKETGSCIAAEYLGIPSVMIAAPGFDEQAVTTAYNNGVPALRVATYPGAFATHTEEQLKENTRNVLWPQILTALTTDITPEEIAANQQTGTGDARTVVYNASIDEINRFFTEMSWSDGLPIVPPTGERVYEFLRFTDYEWDEEIATLSPAYRSTLTWHVAVNGVMAGCKPEYMPILIALTKAMGDPNFRRTLGSTHAWIPYCWVNGPVARQLGFDYGQGQINEEANMALGRFLNLAMMNLMGYYVKQDRMGTFGYPMSWCLAENEEACLGIRWQPYHVRQGYGLNDNTITAGSALLWGNNLAPATSNGEKIMQLMAWDITERSQLAVGSGMQYTFRTILITPEVARCLKETYGTLGNLEDELITTARRSLYERAYANYYANPGSSFDNSRTTLASYQRQLRREEGASRTTTPEWYDNDNAKMMTIPTMQKGETAFLITGDPSRNKVQTMPGGGYGTVKIELPEDWDALMEEKGYPALSTMYLSTKEGVSAPSALNALNPDNAPVRTDYYNMMGQRTNRHRHGIYTRRSSYSNGSAKTQKEYYE